MSSIIDTPGVRRSHASGIRLTVASLVSDVKGCERANPIGGDGRRFLRDRTENRAKSCTIITSFVNFCSCPLF
jgi:hypothetical protein